MGKPATLDKPEQNQVERAESPMAAEAALAAWSKHSRDPKIDRMETFVDDKIKNSGASEADQKAMKALSHAIAEGDLKSLDKVVKALGKDPEALARIAKEMDEVFQKSGLRIGVSLHKDKVLEIDDRNGGTRLMLPVDGKPMGNLDGVHYDDYNKKDREFNRMVKPSMESNAEDVAKDISKGMVKRYLKRSGEEDIVF